MRMGYKCIRQRLRRTCTSVQSVPTARDAATRGAKEEAMDRSMLKRLVEYRVNWILTQYHKVAKAQPGERLRTAAMSAHVRRVLRNHPDERVRNALSLENAGYKGFDRKRDV